MQYILLLLLSVLPPCCGGPPVHKPAPCLAALCLPCRLHQGRANLRQLAKSWAFAYLGNVIGCALFVMAIAASGVLATSAAPQVRVRCWAPAIRRSPPEALPPPRHPAQPTRSPAAPSPSGAAHPEPCRPLTAAPRLLLRLRSAPALAAPNPRPAPNTPPAPAPSTGHRRRQNLAANGRGLCARHPLQRVCVPRHLDGDRCNVAHWEVHWRMAARLRVCGETKYGGHAPRHPRLASRCALTVKPPH
jgi:hypothetical protein